MESLCPSVVCPIMSAEYLLNRSPSFFFFFTKLCMVVYSHEMMCHAGEKMVHYCQCQRHSECLYNQNMTILTISSKLLVRLQPNLVC